MNDAAAQKTALVTGSGRHRVGRAVVAALAARGYAVAIHYHRSGDAAERTVQQLQEEGCRAAAFPADVSQEADVDRLLEQTLSTFGRLDALVTTAAIWERKPLEDVTAADVSRHFAVNALGTFLCCQKAGLVMAQRPEGGAIVTIGDWAVARPYPGYAAYFPSKGAVEALTRSLAVELARRNPAVRVNCVLPGPVMLPDDMPEAERRRVIAGTLVKREGRAENIAHAVLFLLENDFVTGVCLPVDGGRTIAG